MKTSTQKTCICRIWHLGKRPGKSLCTTINGSFFLLPLCGKPSCEAQWTNAKEFFLKCLCERWELFIQTGSIQNIYISNEKLTVCTEINQHFHQFPIFYVSYFLTPFSPSRKYTEHPMKWKKVHGTFAEQNYRIAWAGKDLSTRPGCSAWPWTFPELGHWPNLWVTCSHVSPLSLQKLFYGKSITALFQLKTLFCHRLC